MEFRLPKTLKTIAVCLPYLELSCLMISVNQALSIIFIAHAQKYQCGLKHNFFLHTQINRPQMLKRMLSMLANELQIFNIFGLSPFELNI